MNTPMSDYQASQSYETPLETIGTDSEAAGEKRTYFNFGLFFHHFFSGLLRFWWIILILASIGAGFYALRSFRNYRPHYTSEAILTVSVDVATSSSYYNTATAKQMAATFPYILTSTQLLDLVKADLGVSNLDATIRASVVEGSNLFTISVTASDPRRAYDVLLSVLDTYPGIADYVVGATQLRLITDPQIAVTPTNKMNISSAAAHGARNGALAGIALLILYALLDLTIVNTTGIENRLNGSCIGQIPFEKRTKTKKNVGLDIRSKDISPAFRESIRSMRHDISRVCKKNGAKVILVTSTASNEGKSTASVNLALSLAESGERVIIIDCDLRKPALKYHMGIKDETPGLAAVLNHSVSFRNAVTVIPETGLHALLSSSRTENASELFGTAVMDTFLKSLREVYDYIILDTAPVALVSDTAALARYADGLLYVIRQDFVFTSNILESIRQLSASGIEMIGFVLSITNRSFLHRHYGYSYYNHYGYKYGYGYGKYGYGYSSYGQHDSKKSSRKRKSSQDETNQT
ncbi:MAG: polysaccharide biosynthesis tyrosine autokinase [Clostridia bacterium]|nr:polysaccharide biosynthesis tyrosine autokinase [Clostridia bacterium]